MDETEYLLRSPTNAARLLTAVEEIRRSRSLITKTADELHAMAEELRLSVNAVVADTAPDKEGGAICGLLEVKRRTAVR